MLTSETPVPQNWHGLFKFTPTKSGQALSWRLYLVFLALVTLPKLIGPFHLKYKEQSPEHLAFQLLALKRVLYTLSIHRIQPSEIKVGEATFKKTPIFTTGRYYQTPETERFLFNWKGQDCELRIHLEKGYLEPVFITPWGQGKALLVPEQKL